MNQEAHDLWARAVRSCKTSAGLVEEDPDAGENPSPATGLWKLPSTAIW